MALLKQVGRLSIDAAAAMLVNLAADVQAARRGPVADGVTVLRVGAFTLSDIFAFPEPSKAWVAADAALKSFADDLASEGGLARMIDVYDMAAFTYGDRAVAGVSSAWHGHAGWIA